MMIGGSPAEGVGAKTIVFAHAGSMNVQRSGHRVFGVAKLKCRTVWSQNVV